MHNLVDIFLHILFFRVVYFLKLRSFQLRTVDQKLAVVFNEILIEVFLEIVKELFVGSFIVHHKGRNCVVFKLE